MLKKSDEIECVVLKVEEDKQRIALGLKQLHEDPWARAVPENYIPGQIVEGTVTKIANFGVFVELEADLEGLLHVSELADHKVEDPHDEVQVGERILAKILRVDAAERKIALSKKRAEWSADQEGAVEKKPKPRRGGLVGPGEETTGLVPNVEFTPPADMSLTQKPEPEPTGDTPETGEATGEATDEGDTETDPK
jgi:small subunit ribosomal protein S1